MTWSHKKVAMQKRAASRERRPVDRDPDSVETAEENQQRLRKEFYARDAARQAAAQQSPET